MVRKSVLFCLAMLLAACQGGPVFQHRPAPTSGPTPFPEDNTVVVHMGSYKLIMACKGKGEPTIVLEHGLDTVSWSIFSLDRFKPISRTCLYLRVGLLGEKIVGPRTSMDQVKDLHTLLMQGGVPGPYILVGHSIAGFNLLLYTGQYPKDVVGLVCVDCRYATFDSIFMNKLSWQNPNDLADILDARKKENQLEDDWMKNDEHLDIRSSEKQVLKVTTLVGRPLIVLVAGGHYLYRDQKINQLYEEAWMEANQDLSKLSSRGQIEVLPDDDQDSILKNKKVDAAVRQVFTAVKPCKRAVMPPKRTGYTETKAYSDWRPSFPRPQIEINPLLATY